MTSGHDQMTCNRPSFSWITIPPKTPSVGTNPRNATKPTRMTTTAEMSVSRFPIWEKTMRRRLLISAFVETRKNTGREADYAVFRIPAGRKGVHRRVIDGINFGIGRPAVIARFFHDTAQPCCPRRLPVAPCPSTGTILSPTNTTPDAHQHRKQHASVENRTRMHRPEKSPDPDDEHRNR